ncbi:DUF2057 family protein [Vibrio sp. 404]|uniref:UPF0319 protein H2O73_03430 n=1 Tax=Vibrio marinisediminis TaxID=2758441 RepID=A0A7W2FNJ4_9VIBR|nr:DUF2057 family protein [Vibrio marinisediminis]MBA5761386.1 DUF2057 family protein [Vibrio marinisediminis]
MKTITTLFAGLCFIGAAHAEVNIEIPDNVQLLAVNAEKPALEGGLFSSDKTLTLEDGENQIVVRYLPYFSKGSDRVIVESQAVIAKFTAENQDLTFELPEFRNERDAEKHIGDWQVKLVNQQGQSIEIAQDALHRDGLQLGRNYIIESEEYNRTNGVAALTSTTVATATMQMTATSAVTDAKVDSSTAEEMLHFWYQKADQETRNKFKQYVNQQ